MIIECITCGKKFRVKPSRIKRGVKYCSRYCHYNVRKKYIIKCKVCNKEFAVISSRGNTAEYCSRNCKSKSLAFLYGFQEGHPQFNSGRTHIKKGSTMEKSISWKGGKTKNSAGYILIYSPNHPFHSKQGYVFEHRLVMEKYLGRYLTPKEVVHHINGIIDDNRIENLKLFSNNTEHRKYHSIN